MSRPEHREDGIPDSGEVADLAPNDIQEMESKPVYVSVDAVESVPLEGCSRTSRRELLQGENLLIGQVTIVGEGQAEDYGESPNGRLWYVLEGEAALRGEAGDTPVSPGSLIVVPPGTWWGPDLHLLSGRLTVLDVAARAGGREAVSPPVAQPPSSVRVVRAEDVPPYEPAGHFNTTNRCLYMDEAVEIIEGTIEAGGGAQRHLHREHEQALYLLETSNPLLIYYPRGTPHGTEGGVSSRLRLLVIYSPPLGESQDALR